MGLGWQNPAGLYPLPSLYTHKLQESDSVLNHLSVFKEIVSDLHAMEVDYDDEDLGFILLCSLSSFFFVNFRDTLLYSHDTLTIDEVYEVLHANEKIKQMVSSEGSAPNGEVLSICGRTKNKLMVIEAKVPMVIKSIKISFQGRLIL